MKWSFCDMTCLLLSGFLAALPYVKNSHVFQFHLENKFL
jgi:hypothetical protein